MPYKLLVRAVCEHSNEEVAQLVSQSFSVSVLPLPLPLIYLLRKLSFPSKPPPTPAVQPTVQITLPWLMLITENQHVTSRLTVDTCRAQRRSGLRAFSKLALSCR